MDSNSVRHNLEQAQCAIEQALKVVDDDPEAALRWCDTAHAFLALELAKGVWKKSTSHFKIDTTNFKGCIR